MKFFSPLARGSVVVLAIALAATRFNELHFMLDNLSNFPVHFAAMFLASAAILAICRDLRWAIVSATGAAICLAPVVPWYFSGTVEPPAPEAKSVSLLVSNVHVHNRQHAKLIRLIAEQQPDVVGLVELNSRWLRKLGPLRTDYPFHFEIPDEATVGIALYSKLRLSNAQVLCLGESESPAIAATMETPDGDIEIILAHPMSPLDADHVQRRNAQLRTLGRYVSKLDRPVVLAGDLNLTMWNRNYREFATSGGLHNARAGHGVGPTWPSVWPLGVPIDHVLGTAPVEFRNFRVHGDIGSDHLPVSAEFSLR